MKRVACIGECMLELSGTDHDRMRLSYGGDTLNTATYLARLGVAVDYVTALGDDLEGARERAYTAYDRIQWSGKFCRRDIGRRNAAPSGHATSGA